MSVLLNVVFPVLLIAALVFVAQPYLRLDARTLSRITFYFFSPALVLDSLANSSLDGGEFGRVALAVILVTLALWALSALLVRLLRLDSAAESAFLLATLFVNAGNYGLPVTLFAFGEAGLAIATIYFATSSMIQSSLGVYLAARGNTGAWEAARATLRVPIVYAALLGLVLNASGAVLPGPLSKSLGLLGGAAIPVMLVVLGMQFANLLAGRSQQFRSALRPLALTIATRLLIGPALGLTVALLLGLQGLSRNVVIVESAMPTAVMTIILATEYRVEPEFVTTAVFTSTVVSVVTVSSILTLLT